MVPSGEFMLKPSSKKEPTCRACPCPCTDRFRQDCSSQHESAMAVSRRKHVSKGTSGRMVILKTCVRMPRQMARWSSRLKPHICPRSSGHSSHASPGCTRGCCEGARDLAQGCKQGYTYDSRESRQRFMLEVHKLRSTSELG